MNQSNAGFIDFIDETLGLKLDPSLDWAPLQEQVQDVINLNWESSLGLQRLARRIEIHKSLNVHNAEFRFKPMYDQFLGQCLESILNDAEHFDTHAQAIPAIMRTLTFQNTESMDSDILAKIAPGFKEKLDEHYGLDWLAGCLMDGLYYSTQLWNAVGFCISDKLATLTTVEQPDMDTTEFRLIHRYLPDLVTFSNEQTMSGYFRMYGIHPTYRLKASQIQRFLVGPHHNVASWRAVIESLEQEPHTTEGAENFENQLRVIETKLSTLVVDPVDSMAWELWRVLDRWSKTSEKVSPVYERIQKIHSEMHNAYIKYWPLISSVYPNDEKLTHEAASYYQAHHGVDEKITSWELSNECNHYI